MARKTVGSPKGSVSVQTPLWQLRMPGSVPPIVFFIGSMGGFLLILWKTVDALATEGSWVLGIAFAVLLLQLYLVRSVVRLVEHHPEGLMGGSSSSRRQIRKPRKGPPAS
jgi:hypothetical protein